MDASWDLPLANYLDRGRQLHGLGLGLFQTIVLYNSNVVSVLAFVAQFAEPPKRVLAAESSMLRLLSRGAYGWLHPLIAVHLSTLGFPMAFKSVSSLALASAFRLLHDKLLHSQVDRGAPDDNLTLQSCFPEWEKHTIKSYLRRVAEKVLDLDLTDDDIPKAKAHSLQACVYYALQLKQKSALTHEVQRRISKWSGAFDLEVDIFKLEDFTQLTSAGEMDITEFADDAAVEGEAISPHPGFHCLQDFLSNINFDHQLQSAHFAQIAEISRRGDQHAQKTGQNDVLFYFHSLPYYTRLTYTTNHHHEQ